MKILLFALGLTLSSMAQASVVYTQRDVYNCSDGNTYHVAREYIGGWGPGGWDVIAFCNVGILKQQNYDRFYEGSEVDKCKDEDSRSIRACYHEFSQFNSLSGQGRLPTIKNYEKQTGAKPIR